MQLSGGSLCPPNSAEALCGESQMERSKTHPGGGLAGRQWAEYTMSPILKLAPYSPITQLYWCTFRWPTLPTCGTGKQWSSQVSVLRFGCFFLYLYFQRIQSGRFPPSTTAGLPFMQKIINVGLTFWNLAEKKPKTQPKTKHKKYSALSGSIPECYEYMECGDYHRKLIFNHL